MDKLTFLAKLLEYGAWPIAAIAIVALLRGELRALIPAIKKFKAGPIEVELERVAKELEVTKKVAQNAEAKADVVVAKFDEVDPPTETATPASSERTHEMASVTEREIKVLRAMTNSRFALRSMTGVARETELSKAEVQSTYGALIEKGLLEQTKNKEGNPRWFPTALGRIVANEA